MARYKLIIRIVLLIFIVSIIGVWGFHPVVRPFLRSQDLEKRIAYWQEQAPAHYQYIVYISCLCPPEMTQPVFIEVQNSTAAVIRYVDYDKDIELETFNRYSSVEKIFSRIQDAIDSKARYIHVRYNEEIGYPTKVAIDYDSSLLDDEISFEVSEFRILP